MAVTTFFPFNPGYVITSMRWVNRSQFMFHSSGENCMGKSIQGSGG